MLLRKIARPLLGTAFIASGVDAVRAPAGPARAAQPLLKSVPAQNQTVIQAAGAVQIGAGLALAVGKAPRISSTILATTLVPTTLFASDFWNETDPGRKAAKQSAFTKNLGLLGGVMIAAADTEGKPSLGWRGRRKLRRAEAAVSAALPAHRPEIASTWDGVTARVAPLADATRSKAVRVADAAPAVLNDVRQQAETVVAEVSDRAPAVAAAARDIATKAGENTAARTRRWRSQITN